MQSIIRRTARPAALEPLFFRNTTAATSSRLQRGYATAQEQLGTPNGGPSQKTMEGRAGSQGAKLSFRFGPSNVPTELWPMGFIIGAGLMGGSFALYRHLSSDDLRHHDSKHIDQKHGIFTPSDRTPSDSSTSSHSGTMATTATNYKGNGTVA